MSRSEQQADPTPPRPLSPPPLTTTKPTTDCEVIIIGAGLSGLTAANELQQHGVSCIVLEARGRVGGKTWSVAPLNDDRIVDVGAAWINDTNQSEVYALAKELGLELVVQNTVGRVVQEDVNGGLSTFEYGGAPDVLSEEGGVEEMVRVRQLFEDTCQGIDARDGDRDHRELDQMSLADWVKAHSSSVTALASASVWTRAMLGLEPDEVSALYFLNYCKSGGGLLQMRKDTKDGGQYLRFVQGTQSLCKGLAARLLSQHVKLCLSSPVTSIEQSAADDPKTNIITVSVSVSTLQTPVPAASSSQTQTQTRTHTYTARQLILTLPTPLHTTITFTPPLPAPKLTLSTSTLAGSTNKIILLYSTPWWRTAGLCGLLQSFKGPVTVTRDTSVDSAAQYSLTCFLVGAAAQTLSRLPAKQRQDIVIAHINRAFSPSCSAADVQIPPPLAVSEHEWARDAWSRGCPVPCMPPGFITRCGGRTGVENELTRSFGGVRFAGTETGEVWRGYMEGAVRSGKRVAGEVVALEKRRASEGTR